MTVNNTQGYRDATHLRHLADRCEAGAADLQRSADDPAGVLAERGYHDSPVDQQQWGAAKARAAAAARQYAADLRAEADGLVEGQRPSAERIAQAEKVAAAAQCDGILIDRPPTENTQSGEEYRQAQRYHELAVRGPVGDSGAFGHVAETINGVEQVPFWQLGGNAPTSQSAPETDSACAPKTLHSRAADDGSVDEP